MKLKLLSVILVLAALVLLVSCNAENVSDTKTPAGEETVSEKTGAEKTESSEKTASQTDTSAPDTTKPLDTALPAFVDYASEAKLDMNSATKKQEATVRAFIDGDTTHFDVPDSVIPGGILKARYLSINTPESTGKIEEWGKAASKFTKSKLQSAKSIIIESDDDKWNVDSTGGRYLVWIWYRTEDGGEYRNLNLEILQNGLAIASNSANNRYGSYSVAAINQAKSYKLKIYSGEKDPDFPYGEAQELTLKELRTNIEKYDNAKVAFEATITRDSSNGVYVEDYDDESGIYYGIYVYYGFGTSGDLMKILSVGNRVRFVGTVTYYETGGTYQVSGLSYRAIKPNDPGNTRLISEGNKAADTLTDPVRFSSGNVTVTVNDENGEGTDKEFSYASLVMNTSISMENLRVTDVYTTKSGNSEGAMTLTCRSGDTEICVRTVVIYDSDGNLIKESAYNGKTINVKGIVDFYGGNYQIKVLSAEDITVVD